MRLTWYGHSAFLLEAGDGTRIVIDPYRSGCFDNELRYGPVGDVADAVVATHTHEDHGAVDTVPGHPVTAVHPQSLNVGPFAVTGIPSFHDAEDGRRRGDNTIIVVDVEGLRLAHLGDLGHALGEVTQAALGKVDVLLVPVGGTYTIDAAGAAKVVEQLKPKIVIPMHYKTEVIDLPLAPVDGFLRTQKRVRDDVGSSMELTAQSLPDETTTYVMQHAR